MCEKIIIGGAWPYANGSLHIGHLAGLLPGDVLARYHRAAGDEVYYVSGSDCHGTPVAIRAKKEGRTPSEVSEQYHREFEECFRKLGFSYDVYGKTSQPEHVAFVQEFHKNLYRSKYVYEKEVPQAYCETCKSPIVLKKSKHLYLALTHLKKELKELVDTHPNWRKNAVAFTNRYLEEGLRDRALTRDLDWGIDVPLEGFEGKKIYIWAENVLGYLSMTAVAAKEKGLDLQKLWKEARHYYVHAKDNIPFHTIILPALLLAEGGGWRLPDDIISNEYLTLEGKKISTSQNWAIWVKDIVDRFQPDALRYFLIANGPEKRDTDFSAGEFVKSINGELLGTYGNFVNRSLVFIEKYFESTVPEGQIDPSLQGQIHILYGKTARLIEAGRFKDALEGVFAFLRDANKYFDTKEPWITRTQNPAACRNTLYNCVQIIANAAVLLSPFLPFSSEKIESWLGIGSCWGFKSVPGGVRIPKTEVLFVRLDSDQPALKPDCYQ